MSAGSPWGRFAALMLDRYGPASPGRPAPSCFADVLELCNEPNLQWWPQRDDGGALTTPSTVTRMFATAATLADARPGAPLLAGPGTADVRETDARRTGYAEFTEALLASLDALGVQPGPAFAWSHHNYADVAFDQGRGTTGPDPTRTRASATDVRARIAGRWRGWPHGDARAAGLLLTEGGVTLPVAARLYPGADPRRTQADLLLRNARRMESGEGAGVAMLSQYLWYSDPRFDSGLCDEVGLGGARRPAFAAWARPAR